jgi:hypothetical protein
MPFHFYSLILLLKLLFNLLAFESELLALSFEMMKSDLFTLIGSCWVGAQSEIKNQIKKVILKLYDEIYLKFQVAKQVSCLCLESPD